MSSCTHSKHPRRSKVRNQCTRIAHGFSRVKDCVDSSDVACAGCMQQQGRLQRQDNCKRGEAVPYIIVGSTVEFD